MGRCALGVRTHDLPERCRRRRVRTCHRRHHRHVDRTGQPGRLTGLDRHRQPAVVDGGLGVPARRRVRRSVWQRRRRRESTSNGRWPVLSERQRGRRRRGVSRDWLLELRFRDRTLAIRGVRLLPDRQRRGAVRPVRVPGRHRAPRASRLQRRLARARPPRHRQLRLLADRHTRSRVPLLWAVHP